MPGFHLKNRRYVLITYAQAGADFDYWLVLDRFASLGAECIISRELHADEGIHYHVFVDFGRLFSSRKVDVFDVGGRHPNIQPIGKTPGKAWDYVCKDGDIVAGGLDRPGRDADWDPDNFWSAAANQGSSSEFLHFCDQLAPRDLIRGFTQFKAYSGWKWDDSRLAYEQPRGVVYHEESAEGLHEWVVQAAIGAGPTREVSLSWPSS